MWDSSTIDGLRDCPRSSWRWAAAGYRAGVRDGRDDVLAALGEAGESVRQAATTVLKKPALDTLIGRRDPDFRPCSARCQRCSRCVASMAYWARGGRPFLGVEQEAVRARADAA